MRRIAFLASLSLVVACGSSSKSETTSSTTSSSDAKPTPAAVANDPVFEQKLTPWVESMGAKLGAAKAFSGYVHVTRGGKVLYSKAFGYADRASKRAATAETNFRIGSVTKQFTATAILLLEAEGKLALTDPIKKHIPEFPAAQGAVTVHQLLTHTGGVPSYTAMKEVMEKRAEPKTPQQLMELTWNKPLEFSPGTKWSYSNSGYIILGVLIEKLSGMPYAEFMKKRIFDPAGLTRTVAGDAEGMTDRAEGYQVKNDQIVAANKIHMSVPYAAGNIRSTANDLVKWHEALKGTAILSEASKKKLYTPDKQDYAYGWAVKKKDGKTIIGHGGGIDGFLTDYVRVIEDDLVIVVWNNAMNASPSKVSIAARTVAAGGTPEPIKVLTPSKADPKLLAQCSGTYNMDAASQEQVKKMAPEALDKVKTITVTAKTDHLVLKPVGLPELPVRLKSTGNFHSDVGGVTMVCKPAPGKPATEIRLEQGPIKSRFTRKP